jgi:hypothetical protein
MTGTGIDRRAGVEASAESGVVAAQAAWALAVAVSRALSH